MKIFAIKPHINKGLAAMGALILVGAAAAGMATMTDTRAQAQDSPCGEAAGFSDLAPAVLRSQAGPDGQVALSWYGPGVVTDLDSGESGESVNADCTWRTQEDYDEAALGDEHQSRALRYVISRKVEGVSEYETVGSQFHFYSSDGWGTRMLQAWVDADAPNGMVFYRVQAALGQERSRGAVLGRQVGPVVEPAPAPAQDANPNTETPTPPDTVLCFYQMAGEVRSMALSVCSAGELQIQMAATE